jgi:predicted small integral membrane protein
MAWTAPTVIFFAVIFLLLTAMTVWEAFDPCVARRGLLPMPTTRGDRLFIGLLASAFLNLAWIAVTDATQWWALGLSIVLVGLVGRFG